MAFHLPRPYPDELLHSVVARYAAYSGRAVTSVLQNLLGASRGVSVDLPVGLDTIAQATLGVWGLSAREIAEGMTLVPFYTRYLAPPRVAACLETVCTPYTGSVRTMLGVSASRIKPERGIRWCPICRSSDLSNFGETYWRRVHQLPGVFMCVEHDVSLKIWNLPRRVSTQRQLFDATTVLASAEAGEATDTTETDKIVRDVAKRCADLLTGVPVGWTLGDIPAAYTESAIARGFGGRAMSVSMDRFETAFGSFYRETPFGPFVAAQGKTPLGWVRATLGRTKYEAHPTRHALLQVFLESTPVVRAIRLGLARGIWKCPNPYCDNPDDFPIKEVSHRKVGKLTVGMAACGCGFRFTFERTAEADSAMPMVHKCIAVGRTWEKEAARLQDLGFNYTEIARTMMISWHRAARLLRKSTPSLSPLGYNPRTGPDKKLISQWRDEWTEVLRRAPDQSRTWAMRHASSLYKRLHRWDRDWLVSGERKWTRNVFRITEWAARDADWAPAVERAADEIRKERPLRRASVAAILGQAGTPSTVRKALDRLPLTKAELDRCAETIDAFRMRRLLDAHRRLSEEGQPIDLPKLRFAAGLPISASLSPQLEATLQDLATRRAGDTYQ